MKAFWLLSGLNPENWQGAFPCLFHLLTGYYCPGCGGTRAVRLLLAGDWPGSFRYHPFVPYVCLVLAAEAAIFLYTRLKKEKQPYFRGLEKRYCLWVSVSAGIVAVNWIVKNVWLAMGIDLLPPLY